MGDELMRLPLGVNWGLGGGNGIGGPPIANFATEELKKEILPQVYAGRKRLCLVSPSRSTALMACVSADQRCAGCHRAHCWL